MKKITKEDIKRAIETPDIREKAKLLSNNSSLLYLGRRTVIAERYIKQIYDSVPEEDTEEFNHLLMIINAMTSRRDTMYLFHSRLIYNAHLIIQSLEWLKEKELFLGIYNSIYKMHKASSSSLLDSIRQLMKTPKTSFSYSKGTDEFVLNMEEISKNIELYKKTYLNALIQAKTIAVTLENFVEEYNAEDLIPFDIRDVLESFKVQYDKDGSLKAIYRRICPKKKGEMYLFDNDPLFPTYEEVKPNEDVIRRKIIDL